MLVLLVLSFHCKHGASCLDLAVCFALGVKCYAQQHIRQRFPSFFAYGPAFFNGCSDQDAIPLPHPGCRWPMIFGHPRFLVTVFVGDSAGLVTYACSLSHFYQETFVRFRVAEQNV